MSVSVILLLLPFMSNFGPAPSRMTRKISPSVDPRSHLASVRSEGCVPSGAIGPLPFASALWQKRQFFWKSAWPALIDSGEEATGFFNFFPASLPPGFCVARIAAEAITIAAMTIADVRRMMSRILTHLSRGLQRSSPLGRVVAVPDLLLELEAPDEHGEHLEEPYAGVDRVPRERARFGPAGVAGVESAAHHTINLDRLAQDQP